MDTVGSRNLVSLSVDHRSSVLDPIYLTKATFALLSDAVRAPVSLSLSLSLSGSLALCFCFAYTWRSLSYVR